MGLNAEIYVWVPEKVTGDELEREERELVADLGSLFHCPPNLVLEPDRESEWVPSCPGGGSLIHVDLLARYWSPQYPRGPWPKFVAIWRWFANKYPDGIVYYGTDSGGGFDRLTPELVARFARARGRP